MERYEDAMICITKAIEIRPDWPLYLCFRVKVYYMLGNWKMVKQINKALDDLNKAFQITKDLKETISLNAENINLIRDILNDERQ